MNAMTGSIDVNAVLTKLDAKNLYITLLGRPPESVQRVNELTGQRFGEVIRTFLASAEFEENLQSLIDTGDLPDRPTVKSADMAAASDWLSDLTGTVAPASKPSWAAFLNDVLAQTALAEMVPNAKLVEPAKGALEALAERDAELDSELAQFLAFDPDWFAASAGGRVFTSGGADAREPLPAKGALPAVLPFFTDGLEVLSANGRPETIGKLISASRAAARDGDLHHWLWDARFYNLQADRSEKLRGVRDVTAPPYLEFLAHGDEADVPPHPLFSPYAYRKLNPGVDPELASCFVDFVGRPNPGELLTTALFDPEYYMSLQPEVRTEVALGRYSSALEHFVRVGLHRDFQFLPDFDRDFYLNTNPDIHEAVSSGAIPSAAWHFVTTGVYEGRAPNRFFDAAYYVSRYPYVGEEMQAKGILSPLEHFLLLGRARGYRVNHPPLEMRVDADHAKALFEKRGRRAYGEALSGVFRYETAALKPGLSVIVPISGQADFTAGFLKCARYAADYLEFKRGVTAEIVIVDNGSKDHTETLLKALPGVKVVSFDAPIGFPAAVNAGAKASTGGVIIIANNDIEFQADAFLRIYDGLAADASIGVLGAKIILPDETLQEVGSVLDKDGSSHGLARGMPAYDCLGVRNLRVDYASGCFIGVRRADFTALGMLNEDYSPGYYEEVDFSIRMKRDLGKDTVVDTGLAITHYEHASFAKGRPPSVSAALILRNRVRIRAEHAATFAAIDNPDPAARARQIQTAMTGGGRVLVIEDMIPSSLLGSGFCREEEILDILMEAGIAFDIIALNPSPRVQEYKNPLVKLYRGWVPGEHLEEVLAHHGHKYSHVWLCRTHNLGRAAAGLRALKERYGVKVVCDTEAIASLRLADQMALRGDAPSPTVVKSMIAAELTDPIGIDLWVAVNPIDKAHIENVGVGPVQEIGHAVTFKGDTQPNRSFSERHRVTFIGAVHELTGPNYDSLNWYLTEVAPRLGEDVVLTVAGFWGAGLDATFKAAFKDSRIDFRGAVSQQELADLYAESRLTIAPTRYAGGIPYKVMESVMASVPVVMTHNLATQFGIETNDAFSSAPSDDGGAAFAAWVDRLYHDERAWQAQRELQAKTIGDQSSVARLRSQVLQAAKAVGLA